MTKKSDEIHGEQNEYKVRAKGKKKAEIEAKKAAIRGSDIAKGLFVPVSSLPQREPMKAVIRIQRGTPLTLKVNPNITSFQGFRHNHYD